jgi:hypothetical protein
LRRDKFDANGILTDENTKEFLRKMLQALVDWTIRLKGKQDSAAGQVDLTKKGPRTALSIL